MKANCEMLCPMANSRGRVMPQSQLASIETFPEDFSEIIPGATPESIALFIHYQKHLVGISMHETVGGVVTKNHNSAYGLLSVDVPEGAKVACGLTSKVNEAASWERGGAGSFDIRGGLDCPYLGKGRRIYGAVTSLALE